MPDQPSQPRLVKLIRDRMGELLSTSTVRYAPIPDRATRIRALRSKLVEESAEYLANPSLGELADVLEVVRALAEQDLDLGGGAVALVLAEAASKRRERGGFRDGVGMYVETTASARHEGGHQTQGELHAQGR